MKKIFDIKRTKMVDEAARGHTPSHFGRVFLAFFLVYIISNAAINLITTLPLTIYNFAVSMKDGSYDLFKEAMDASDLDKAIDILYEISANVPWWAFAILLFGYGFLIFASIFYCKKFEKRAPSSMGIRKKGVIVELLLGSLIGGALAGICCGLSIITGSLTFKLEGFSIAILLFIPAFFVFALGEELLVRGFFMTSLARDISPLVAVISSSLLFAIFNIGTLDILGFINTFLFGILLGVYVFKRGSIWGAVAIKAVWGFTLANILGTNVFGYSKMLSILSPVYSNKAILSGSPELGFMSGILTTILLACVTLILLLLNTKKGEESEVKVEYFN